MSNYDYNRPPTTQAEPPPARTENDTVAELALRAAPAVQLELGSFYVIHNGDGGLDTFDLTGDKWRDFPKRITDKVHLTHLDGLRNYWNKYADLDSEMWADPTNRTITAILDAHADREGPDWQQHRATLKLHLSDPLKAWIANNDKPLTQEQFGEFLEEQIPHILAPTGAELMEMVQGLEVNQTAEFKSGIRLKTGARVMHYLETIDGRTRDSKVEIPDHITLRLPIWNGDTASTELTARFRFRPNQPRQGQVALYYKLNQVREVIDGAFAAIVDELATHIDRPVYHGTPAS